MKTEDYTAQNRRGWDEIAALRHRRQQPAEYFADGGCELSEHILSTAGDVNGMRLCHLQCSTGEDTLSWANRGADATGVDISLEQIKLAKEKTDLAGLSVRFIASDVCALPQSLLAEDFDVVFTGGGSLMWLPELGPWAQAIATLLKPGGRLILEEEHPLADCMGVQDGQVRMLHDYFGRKPETYKDWTHFPGGENATEDKFNFTWPLGDVVTSLCEAGLRIELLEEMPNLALYRFGEHLDETAGLPGEFVLVASKDRSA